MSFGLCGRLSLTQQIELHASPSRSISTLSSTSSDTMSPSKQASGAPASSSNQGEEEEAVLNNTSTVTADADVAECPAASTETEQGQDAADDEVQDVTADHLRAIQKEKSYIKFRSPPKSIFKKTGTKWWTVHHVDFAHIRSLKRRLKTEISVNELETMGGILRCFEILDEASEDDPQEEVYESIAKRLFVCPRCFDNASSPLLKATILCTEGVSSNIGQHNLRVHEELPEKKSEPLLENSKQPLMSSYSQPMKSREETVQTFRTKVYEFINDNGFPASTVEKPNFRDLLSFTIKHAPRLSSQDVVISNKAITKMRLLSYNEFLKTIAMLCRNVRSAYKRVCNNNQTPFASVCHDIWQGNKKDVLGVVVTFIDPRNCTDYKIPVGLCTTKGHTAQQVATHTLKILHSVGFTRKDLCASVNDNTNSAVLAGKYILGNKTGGKCDMHRAELILKHATGIAVRKRRGEVIDENPSFLRVYKIFLKFGSWLMSGRAKRFDLVKDYAEKNGKAIIEIPMPNQTRVGGCGIMFHGFIRIKHVTDAYYHHCCLDNKDKEFRNRYPKKEDWEAMSQFESILAPLKTCAMTLQSDDPSASAAALLEIFNSKHVIKRMKQDGVRVLMLNVDDNDNLPRWDAKMTMDALQSKRKKIPYDKLLPSSQLLIKRLLIEYRNYMEEGQDIHGENAMLGHPFLCKLAPSILKHNNIYDDRDIKRIREQYVNDCVDRLLVIPREGTTQTTQQVTVDVRGQEVANEVPNDGNDNNDNDSEVSEDDAFNIFASYKAAQDREANARRMTTGGNGGQNNKQVLRDKLYEKINDEFGQFMDYSERMVQSSWESHIRKFPSAVFRKESATWTPKQWSRFKVACNKLLFSRVGKYFDVLSWWAIFKDRFPQIFPTAIIWTAKPATNAFQERVFSTASLMDANKRMNRQLDKNFEMRTLGCLTRPLVEIIWKRENDIMDDEKKKREAEGGGEEDAVVVVDDSQWWTEDEEDEARSVPTTGGVKPTQDEEAKTQAKKHQVPIGQLAEDSTQGEMLRMEQIVRATNSYQEHLDKGNSLDEGILMEPYKFSANDNDEVADDRSVDSVEILDIVDMTDIDQVEMMDRGRTYQTTDDSDFALVTVAREEKETLKAYASVIGGDTDKEEALNNNQVSENGPGNSMKTPSSSARKRKGSVDATPTSAASSSTTQKQKRARKAPGSKGSRSSKNPSKRRQTKLQQAFPKKKPPPTTENTTEQEQPAAASKKSSASASSSARKGTWTSPRTKK